MTIVADHHGMELCVETQKKKYMATCCLKLSLSRITFIL